jgi:hypothetical protein
MSPFQSFSVKSAEILLARMQEISESQVLNQTFIAQTGYGNVELTRKINALQKQIDDAKMINDIIGTNEAKINMTDGNTYFVLIDIFKKYEERTNPKANGL